MKGDRVLGEAAFQSMLASLPKRSGEQLKLLRERLAFLTDKPKKTLSPDEQLLYRELVGALRGHVPFLPKEDEIGAVPRVLGFDIDRFRAGYAAVLELMKEIEPEPAGAKRIVFYRRCVEAVADGTRRMAGAEPWGIIKLVEGLLHVREFMDRTWPGYRESGLLGVILGSLSMHKT